MLNPPAVAKPDMRLLSPAHLPCPVLATDAHGTLLALNAQALQLAGGSEADWLMQPMERLFPLPSRIFLQTHVWPMLLRDGAVAEAAK